MSAMEVAARYPRSAAFPRGRRKQRRLLLAVLSGALLSTGCAPYIVSRTNARHVTLREESVGAWARREIGEQEATQFLIDRSALIFSPADHAALEAEDKNTMVAHLTRAGQPSVGLSAGSAVALTDDGYFLTAAHCVDREPYVVVLRDSRLEFVQAPGRTVWDGYAAIIPVDLALIHVPGVESMPLEWYALAQISPGGEVLCAGAGVGSYRLAAGRVIGGPTTQQEAAAGSAHVFHVDAPIVRGDSGGPVISLEGRLLGVSTKLHVRNWNGFRGDSHGVVLRPDPSFLRSLIQADRERLGSDREDTAAPADDAERSPARGADY